MSTTDKATPRPEDICGHCGWDKAVRNPSGWCDHLYYPENCGACSDCIRLHEPEVECYRTEKGWRHRRPLALLASARGETP